MSVRLSHASLVRELEERAIPIEDPPEVDIAYRDLDLPDDVSPVLGENWC